MVEPGSKFGQSAFWSYQGLILRHSARWVWKYHLRAWIVSTAFPSLVGAGLAMARWGDSEWTHVGAGLLTGLLTAVIVTAAYGIVGALRVSARIHQDQEVRAQRAEASLRLPISDPEFESVRSMIADLIEEARMFQDMGETASQRGIAYKEAIETAELWSARINDRVVPNPVSVDLVAIVQAHEEEDLPEHHMWKAVEESLSKLERRLRPVHIKRRVARDAD